MRLLHILEEVASAGVPVTPVQVNQRLGLAKQTLYRHFAQLEEEGLLQREHDGRAFGPGPKFRAMAIGVISSQRIRAARLAVMNRLAEAVGETVNLTIPDRDAMIYLDRVETTWPLRVQLPIGSHVPFHCTASGKLYLSTLSEARLETVLSNTKLEKLSPHTITSKATLLKELQKIREDGYAQDDEEFIEGMIALAVPVVEKHGRLASTLSFHAPTIRLPLDKAYEHLSRLKKAAADLSSLISKDQTD